MYYVELDAQGAVLGEPQAVTERKAAAFFPRLLRFRERSNVFYFSGTNKVFVAEPSGAGWSSQELNELTGSSYFAYPAELAGKLYVFWENRVGNNSRLIMLQPDQSVEAPRLAAVNFDPRRASRQELVQVRWTTSPDSSGILGFSYVWSQKPDAPVPTGEAALLADATSASVRADRDGTWYFRLAVEDYAGNWSAPATIAFTRDTIPPGRPTLSLPQADEKGYLPSNSFNITWKPADSADVSGYAVNMEYVGSTEAPVPPGAPPLPATANTAATRASYANLDNGLWAFAVAALDAAGNLGEPSVAYLRLDRYVPVTYISYLNEQRDALGAVDLTIGGRGFELGGMVSQVIVDRDGAVPYDYVFRRESGSFRVVSDRLIRGLTLLELDDGVYRVGVVHPVRGTAWSGPVLRIQRPGTVKFGDFSYVYRHPWESVRLISRTFSAGTLAVWMVVLFLLAVFLVSVRRLASLAEEGRLLRREVLAVMRGEVPLARKVVKLEELKRKGFGLRWKFTGLTMSLVLITVLAVATALGAFMINNQRKTLAQGLVQRVDTLLGSLASSAADNLNVASLKEAGSTIIQNLNLLPDQVRTMDEAQYLTLTAAGVDDATRFDYVWVSSDGKIDSKLEAGKFESGRFGEVRIKDPVALELEKLRPEIDSTARQQIAGLEEERSRLMREAGELGQKRDAESRAEAARKDSEANKLYMKIISELQVIRGKARIFPALDPQKPPQRLESSYVFYAPIVFRRPGENLYYRGAVRLGVSTDAIRAELSGSQRQLIFWTGIIALAAAGLGLAGALIMAGITVGPINKLMSGVAVIRDTENKQELKGFTIKVHTRDEIGMLADAFNDLTGVWVKADSAQKEMMMGKDIQRMFLPLAKGEGGRLGSTAEEHNDLVEIFGYYEGAREVSGDFFDYKKLSDKYYAMIKCDVSGKGVSAALIMVEVATIFSTYFRGWTPQDPGLKLTPLAYQINDMVEERGFRGRFAALTLAILDSETGKVWLCNAGDIKQHFYRQTAVGMKEVTLPSAPAAGMFPSNEVDSHSGGYKQVSEQLASGDVLFLFTDGFEDGLGEVARGMKGTEENGGPARGPKEAGPGLERIYALIDAVFSRRVFRLSGHRNTFLEGDLEFDFTGCSGSVEEAVMALVSAEKVLRLLPAPDATEKDRVNVDRRIDAFLAKHYPHYGRYFTRKLEAGENKETVTFTNLKEDSQYDDLTILAIRKK